MNKYAAVIGIAFILVTVFSAATLALTVDMYGAFAETKNKITPWEGNVRIEEVRIPPISGTDEEVRVTIILNVSNPTRLDIWVYNIEFSIHMFNKSTMIDVGNPQAQDQFYVLSGGFFTYDDPDYLVPSGGNALLESSLTVTSSLKIAILNNTDGGKYRPLVLADMRYEVVDVDKRVVLRGISYFDPSGVDPYVG
ncbi:MAG: hypothetical protein KAU99_05340 [Thermoplasmata archaeon]|nr:hypothetical protein [Thermoplasmata archaeon]